MSICGNNYKFMRYWTDKANMYKQVLLFNSRLIFGFSECDILHRHKIINSSQVVKQ